MLILSRRRGEGVMIGPNVIVKVIRVSGDAVRIGFEAPKEVPIHRTELVDQSPELAALHRSSGEGPVYASSDLEERG